MQTGVESIGGMFVYVATVVASPTAIMILYLVMVAVFGWMNPVFLLKQIRTVQLLAFSTSSSAAVTTLSVESPSTKLDVSRTKTDMLIPLGASMNMMGKALYKAIAIFFSRR
jgi:proton glutamate symport protein